MGHAWVPHVWIQILIMNPAKGLVSQTLDLTLTLTQGLRFKGEGRVGLKILSDMDDTVRVLTRVGVVQGSFGPH